jgi:hypothetical protein
MFSLGEEEEIMDLSLVLDHSVSTAPKELKRLTSIHFGGGLSYLGEAPQLYKRSKGNV